MPESKMFYNYIPLDYFQYNRPEYFGFVIIIIIFILFTIVLYLIFKYEYYTRLDICDPMFYYGKPCVNQNSNLILKDPKFIALKKIYYDTVSKYNDKTYKYEGVRQTTQEGKAKIENADKYIEDNLKQNEDFIKNSVSEIDKLTTICNLITSKYLGNIGSILNNIHSAPDYVLDSIRGLPEHLAQLRLQIEESLDNPYFKQYSSPLQKLYRSLTEIDKKTLPYIDKKVDT